MNVFTLVIIACILYFVPSVVAGAREHPNKGAIFIINLLLGWTFIGWVAALVWSVLAIPRPIQSSDQPVAPQLATKPLIVDETDKQIRCPECRELIRFDANKCRWCGSKIDIPEKWR